MITLFVCGDVMLGRGIDQILPQPCDPTLYEPSLDDARDYIAIAEDASGPIPRGVPLEYPWGETLAVLDAARPDVRIVNLETAITRRGDPAAEKGIHYRVSPDNAACLRAAQVDACALANNHILDWGTAGLFDTLDTLDRLQIARAGAGRTHCRRRGAVGIHAMATHGVFTQAAGELLSTPAIDSVIVTDTVSTERFNIGSLRAKLTIVSIAPLLARAISTLHHEGSLTQMVNE